MASADVSCLASCAMLLVLVLSTVETKSRHSPDLLEQTRKDEAERNKVRLELQPDRDNSYAIGFKNLPFNFSAPISSMSVRGEIPAWLNTSLYRNGPVWWNTEYLNHWFFGLGMVHVFHISASQISYHNNYLMTSTYQHYMNQSDNSKSLNKGGKSAVQSLNTAVTIRKLQNHLLANGGSTSSNEISPVDVSTVQAPFDNHDAFSDEVARSPSHAHTDLDGTVVHFYFVDQDTPGYQFYQIAPHSTKRELLGKVIPAREEARSWLYMHSFALTKHYAILSEVPSLINHGFPEAKFLPELGTRWHIVDRSTGNVRLTLQSPAFMMYHHINAYEDVNEHGEAEIVVDLITYPNMDTLPAMFIDNLLHNSRHFVNLACKGGPHRYRLPLDPSKNTSEILGVRLWEGGMEFPTIYYEKLNTRKHRFIYGVSTTADSSEFLDSLVKIDLDTPNEHGKGASSLVWDGREKAFYPGEPIYVPRDLTSMVEDDGVILSLVLDGIEKHSFLLVLDARTFKELATAPLAYAVPFGFHGRHYFNATALSP